MQERTLLLIKPDGVQRGLVGEIIGRIEKRGFKLVGLKMLQVSKELASKHYAEHDGKPFYNNLVNFFASGPLVAIAVEGPNAITSIRKMIGATNPNEALQGTIRGDFALATTNNLVHSSDGQQSAQRELSLFFTECELFTYTRELDTWAFDWGK